MLHAAISDSALRAVYPGAEGSWGWEVFRRQAVRFVPRLERISELPYQFMKTHDLYPKSVPIAGDMRFLFVYGDPLESAFSVKKMVAENGEAWFVDHMHNLGRDGELSELFVKDILGFEEQVYSWMGKVRGNTLCVEYYDLWEKHGAIQEFLGIEFALPERRSRETIVSPELLASECVDSALFERLRRVKMAAESDYERKFLAQGLS